MVLLSQGVSTITRQEIGSILMNLREKAGKSREEVADLLGKSVKTVGHWETGYAQPDANTLFLLCTIYDADLNESFGFSSEQRKSPSADKSALGEELQREIICLAGKLSTEQTDLFLALLRLTAARNQGLSAADLVSAGEAALKSELQNPTR